MTKQQPFDPFAMWKTFYEQNEANWTGAIQDMIKKESFSEGMGETLNHYLQAQKQMNEKTETFLKNVNLPSRSEVADVATLVINVESKLEALEDSFEEEMNQLKKAVSMLDKKIDRLLSTFENRG